MKIILFALIIFQSAVSFAIQCVDLHQRRYLFGLEFTFTNEAMVTEGNKNPSNGGLHGNPLKKAAWDALNEKIKQKCAATGDCKTEMSYDKHGQALKVTFGDGFYFTVGVDATVLEANAQPLSRVTYGDEAAKRMHEFLFETAREVGLMPHSRAGGGHIHISRKAFDENLLLFRNFFVDFQNRPELIYGGLGNHLGNSAPIAAMKPSIRDSLETVLKTFDFENKKINDFVSVLHSQVFTEGYFAEWGSPGYYQAFNMTRMYKSPDAATLEIRSFRPQESVQVYQLQMKLLSRWIERLRTVTQPIPYQRKDRYDYTAQEIVNSYAQLLKELDLPYDEYRVLLPPQMRALNPRGSYPGVNYQVGDFQ